MPAGCYVPKNLLEEMKADFPDIVSWENICERMDIVTYSVSLTDYKDISYDKPPSLILIDKGSDTLNIDTSVRLYEKFARNYIAENGEKPGDKIRIKTFIRDMDGLRSRKSGKGALRPKVHNNEYYNIQFIPYSSAYDIYDENIRLEKFAENVFDSWAGLSDDINTNFA